MGLQYNIYLSLEALQSGDKGMEVMNSFIRGHVRFGGVRDTRHPSTLGSLELVVVLRKLFAKNPDPATNNQQRESRRHSS